MSDKARSQMAANRAKRRTQGPSATPPSGASGSGAKTGQYWSGRTPGSGSGGTGTSGSSYVPNQQSYQYKSWPELTQRERDLYDAVAKGYHPNSTGKTWYEDQFIPYAKDTLKRTGIAIDPEGEALRFAREQGYDVRGFIASSPNVSPNSVLFNAPVRGAAGPGGGGYRSYGGGGGGGGSTQSVSLTDPSSARGLLMQTMRGLLGRDPDSDEYTQFLQALNEAERANPRKVTMEGSTAVQSGGIDPSMVAMEYVEGLEEFESAEGQRAFSAFMEVLGA